MSGAARGRSSLGVIRVMAGALAGCAGLLLAHVLAPYDRLRSLYDALAPDGEAAFFSQALHQSLGTRLLAPAGALALLSLLLWAKRAAIDHYLRIQLHSDVREFWRLLSESFRHSFADSLWITGGFILVFAVALFLRRAFLGQPLRNDEATTFLYFAQQPWYRAISTT